MKIHPTVLVVAAAVMTGLTGCGAIDGTAAAPAASSVPAGMGAPEQADTDTDTDTETKPVTDTAGSAPEDRDTDSDTSAPAGGGKSAGPVKKKPHGPRIVSFKVVQKPKCPQGTEVFPVAAVPLIIKWKITGADSAALSVDDPTGTPGTYGPVDRQGTQEFTFSCGGPVGSTETHRYDIYTVGGGAQKHKTLKVSAQVLEKGIEVR